MPMGRIRPARAALILCFLCFRQVSEWQIIVFAEMQSLTCGFSSLRLGPARPHQVGLLPPVAQAFEAGA